MYISGIIIRGFPGTEMDQWNRGGGWLMRGQHETLELRFLRLSAPSLMQVLLPYLCSLNSVAPTLGLRTYALRLEGWQGT